MKVSKKSIRIDKEIMLGVSEKFKPFFNDNFNVISVSIQYVFLYRILKCSSEKHKKKILESAKEIPSSKKVTRFCTYDYLLDWLSQYYGTESITHTVKCCLKEVELQTEINESLMPLINPKYHSDTSLKPMSRKKPICARPGNKSGNIGDWVVDIIEDIRNEHKCDKYSSVLCGTANEALHMPEYIDEYLNDNDKYMINLLTVIKNRPFDLIAKMTEVPVNKETHEKYLNMIYDSGDTPVKFYSDRNKERTLEKAMGYLYLYLTAFRQNPKSFNSRCKDGVIKNRIPTIVSAAIRLQHTKLESLDCERFIKNLINDHEDLADFILYFDFPYIGTEEYYHTSKIQSEGKSNEKEEKEKNEKQNEEKQKDDKEKNEEIKELCVKLHTKFKETVDEAIKAKAIVVISYRVTIGTSHHLGENDVREILDSLYRGQQFFIAFKRPNRSNKQIEAVISNVRFKNYIEYDKNVDDIIKESGILETILPEP